MPLSLLGDDDGPFGGGVGGGRDDDLLPSPPEQKVLIVLENKENFVFCFLSRRKIFHRYFGHH